VPGSLPTDGPLFATSGVGGSGLYPPDRGRWVGTFGGNILCTRDGTQVTLRKVTWRASVPPERLEVFVRTVKPTEGRRHADTHTPIGSALGSPPEFDEPYVTSKVGGSFTRRVSGVEITRRCGTRNVERAGFRELLFTLHTDSGGARVNGASIIYTADDQDYVLPLTWEMVACGREIDRSTCPR